ncbi:hypothetical protein EIQ06_08035 [Xanthomonas campestris pv. campestris]
MTKVLGRRGSASSAHCAIACIYPTRRLDHSVVSSGVDDADRSLAERLICGLAAGPLPAYHRGTRRKYVHVASYAASMPRKVPRR